MAKLFDKFDIVFIFISVLGVVILAQTFLFQNNTPEQNQLLQVSISSPINTKISEEHLQNIDRLYFSNAADTSKVVKVEKSTNEYIVTLEDSGVWKNEISIFNGQHFGLNQRVKLHGKIEVEGLVTKVVPQ